MNSATIRQGIAQMVDNTRHASGISKNELAARVWPAISRTNLQRKLNGTKSFTIEELICIAEALDADWTTFLLIPDELKQAS